VKGETNKTAIAIGIACWEKQGDQLNRSEVLPLYSWKRNDYLFTLPYGKTKTYSYFSTPLVGCYLDKRGGWVFPLWQHKKTNKREETNLLLGIGNRYKTETGKGLSLFPLYSTSQSTRPDWKDSSLTRHSKRLNALLLFWNSERRLTDSDNALLEEYATSGLFPLWTKHLDMPRKGEKNTETANLLFRLYDYRREMPKNADEKIYTRHRVLWRLYHKETLGTDTSTDIFPSITIDKKENGFRKYSLLWRLYRYEKDPEAGTTKMDIFFVPLKR
jgi:hypothetical protein